MAAGPSRSIYCVGSSKRDQRLAFRGLISPAQARVTLVRSPSTVSSASRRCGIVTSVDRFGRTVGSPVVELGQGVAAARDELAAEALAFVVAGTGPDGRCSSMAEHRLPKLGTSIRGGDRPLVRSQSAVASFLLLRRQRNQQADVALQTFPASSSSPNAMVGSFGTKRSWVRIPPPRLRKCSRSKPLPGHPGQGLCSLLQPAGYRHCIHRFMQTMPTRSEGVVGPPSSLGFTENTGVDVTS